MRRRARDAEAELAEVVERARRLEGALDLVGEGIIVADVQRPPPVHQRRRRPADRRPPRGGAGRGRGGRRAGRGPRGPDRRAPGRPVRTADCARSPSPPRRSGPGGARLGAVVLVRDESRLRRLEAIRQEFVANVSHELKTPIGAIALLAETLAATDDPADARPPHRPPGRGRPPPRAGRRRPAGAERGRGPGPHPGADRPGRAGRGVGPLAALRWPSAGASRSSSTSTRARPAWATPASSARR